MKKLLIGVIGLVLVCSQLLSGGYKHEIVDVKKNLMVQNELRNAIWDLYGDENLHIKFDQCTDSMYEGEQYVWFEIDRDRVYHQIRITRNGNADMIDGVDVMCDYDQKISFRKLNGDPIKVIPLVNLERYTH